MEEPRWEDLKEKEQFVTRATQAHNLVDLARSFWHLGAKDALKNVEKALLFHRAPRWVESFRRQILYQGLGFLGSLNFRHEGAVTKVRFLPNGQVLSASQDGTVKLWTAIGWEVQKFLSHTKGVTSFDVHWDTKRMVTASEDKTCKVWNLELGEVLFTFTGHTDIVSQVCFLPDGQWVVSAGEDSTVRIWNVESGEERLCFDRHGEAVSALAISPDGRFAASGDWNGLCLVWLVESGKVGASLAHPGSVYSICFSKERRYLYTGAEDSLIRLWDVVSGEEKKQWNLHKGAVREIQLTPEGDWLISSSEDKTVCLYSLKEERVIQRIELIHGAYSQCLHPQRKAILVGGEGPEVQVFHVATAQELTSTWGHQGKVLALAAGKVLVSLGGDEKCFVWDMGQGEKEQEIPLAGRKGRSLALSPSSLRVAIGGGDKEVHVYEWASRRTITQFLEHKATVSALAYHPRLEEIASADMNGVLYIWDGETGVSTTTLETSLGSIFAIQYAPSSEMLVLGGERGCLVLDTQGVEYARFEGHTEAVRSLAVSEEERVYSLDLKGVLKIWELGTGEEVGTLELGEPKLQSVLSLTGTPFLVLGGEEGRFVLLHRQSGQQKEFSFEGNITSLCFSQKLQCVFAGLANGCIRRIHLWELYSRTR